MHLDQISLLAALAFYSLLGLSTANSVSPAGGNAKPTSTLTGLSIKSTNPASASTSTSTPAIGSGTGSTGTDSTTNKMITVVVGSPTLNKSLVFTPSEVPARPGDIVQFQFSRVNHTVTQSTFAEPYLPIQQSNSTSPGIPSEFVPVSANATTVQTFNTPINDTMPMFIYCAQGPDCQLGMMMTINSANGTENFAAYKAAAAKATKNIPATTFRGGVFGNIPSANAAQSPI